MSIISFQSAGTCQGTFKFVPSVQFYAAAAAADDDDDEVVLFSAVTPCYCSMLGRSVGL